MGWWMALNLRKSLPKSTTIYIYDIVPTILENFRDASNTQGLGEVVICRNTREVAENSVRSPFQNSTLHEDSETTQEITFSIVPEGKHVREVYFDENNGVLTGPVGDKTFVDCSTIDPATSRSVAEAISKNSPSAHFYDAPVSGGVHGAEAGILSFLAGASEDDTHFQQYVKPLLQLMGKNIFCIGAQSQGLVAKLCNNYLSGICAIATAEAMNIGIRHGIDKHLLSDVFKKSTGGNWQNGQ